MAQRLLDREAPPLRRVRALGLIVRETVSLVRRHGGTAAGIGTTVGAGFAFVTRTGSLGEGATAGMLVAASVLLPSCFAWACWLHRGDWPRHRGRSTILALCLALSLVAGGVGVSLRLTESLLDQLPDGGWAPVRPTFDWLVPADRSGAGDGVVLNSFVNTPVYGDERDLLTVNKVDVVDDGASRMVIKPGDELVLQVYVHNNAHESLNASGRGIAEDTRVRLKMPTATAKFLRVIAFVSTRADKVAPGSPAMVSDVVDFAAEAPVGLRVVQGSARFYNNAGIHRLGEDLLGDSGALIGYERMDGRLPGCFAHDGWLTVRVVVSRPAEAAAS